MNTNKLLITSAAGILFTCQEDDTVLLALRSNGVREPHTWGIPGGSIERRDNALEDDLEAAKREVKEELGCLPKHLEVIDKNILDLSFFKYTTFIANLSLKEKNNWTPKIKINWEHDDVGWFPKSNLPFPLHFGIKVLNYLNN